MAFNIVLVEPEIPNNTGNIGRLSLASGSVLHLVKPFGFELSNPNGFTGCKTRVRSHT